MAETKISYVLAVYHPTTDRIVITIELNDQQVSAVKSILPLEETPDDIAEYLEYEVPNVFFSAVAG